MSNFFCFFYLTFSFINLCRGQALGEIKSTLWVAISWTKSSRATKIHKSNERLLSPTCLALKKYVRYIWVSLPIKNLRWHLSITIKVIVKHWVIYVSRFFFFIFFFLYINKLKGWFQHPLCPSLILTSLA